MYYFAVKSLYPNYLRHNPFKFPEIRLPRKPRLDLLLTPPLLGTPVLFANAIAWFLISLFFMIMGVSCKVRGTSVSTRRRPNKLGIIFGRGGNLSCYRSQYAMLLAPYWSILKHGLTWDADADGGGMLVAVEVLLADTDSGRNSGAKAPSHGAGRMGRSSGIIDIVLF